jgi:hypothetical protein
MRWAKSLFCALAVVTWLGLGPRAARAAASPADQFVMYVTAGNLSITNSHQIPPLPGFFSSLEAADYHLNTFAHQAGLFDWNGIDYVFKAVMSTQAEPAITRLYLPQGKPILNTLGQQILPNAADLFQGATLQAPILTEYGTAPPPNTPVWTGTLATGTHSNSCLNWTSTSTSGRVGLANATDSTWCNNGLRGCNLSGRIYGLGVLASPRAPGDYNDDGQVDAGDYIVWRNTYGQTGLKLPADGNGNGTIDAGDFDEWRLHFGDPPATASSSTVPEPSTLALLVTLAYAAVARTSVRTWLS